MSTAARSVLGAMLLALVASPALADPVPVRFTEGLAHGFPVLRSTEGDTLALGELTQVARGDVVESRLRFHFRDGSLYDETVVFSQRDRFLLLSYHLVQRGPSFPEMVDASVDRRTGRYEVRYRADEDSAEEHLSGRLDLPPDVYNGLLGMLMKNLPAGESAMVQIVAFTPKPRLVNILLTPVAGDTVRMGETAVPATRYHVRPQLGLFASLLVADIPDAKVWVHGGAAPAFLKFEGPLYFMGPIWRIDWM